MTRRKKFLILADTGMVLGVAGAAMVTYIPWLAYTTMIVGVTMALVFIEVAKYSKD